MNKKFLDMPEKSAKLFVKCLISALIRGNISDREITMIKSCFSFIRKPNIIRDATPQEEKELYEQVQNGTLNQQNNADFDDITKEWYFDKTKFKTALNGNFDTVKDWFLMRFAPRSIVVVIYSGYNR
jgi:hypothetical protein